MKIDGEPSLHRDAVGALVDASSAINLLLQISQAKFCGTSIVFIAAERIVSTLLFHRSNATLILHVSAEAEADVCACLLEMVVFQIATVVLLVETY